MSKQYWVWMNCAPAATFFASLSGRHWRGGASGFSTAPKNTRGGALIFLRGAVPEAALGAKIELREPVDGRRRFLGFQSALAEGLISEDHLVEDARRAIESGAVKKTWPVGVLSHSPADLGAPIASGSVRTSCSCPACRRRC